MAFGNVKGELPRTLFHIVGGIFLAALGYQLPGIFNRVALGAILLVTISVEAARKFSPSFNRFTRSSLGIFMRPSEHDGITGTPAYVGGVFLAFLLFPREIAVASLIPLVLGDRAAVLAGKGFGKIRIGDKTLEGSIACFAVSLAGYLILAKLFGPFPVASLPVLLGASLIGTLAEALPRPFDDNLTIPLAVGAFLKIVSP
jgi:dolichol kinase